MRRSPISLPQLPAPASLPLTQISLQSTPSPVLTMDSHRLSPHAANFDNVLTRLHKLTLNSAASSIAFPRAPSSALISYPDARAPALDAPFALSHPYPSKDFDNEGSTIIDTFAPRVSQFNLSPTSSASSDLESTSSRGSFEAFIATRSRVVRLHKLPMLAESFLSAVFFSQNQSVPVPVTMWALREEYSGQDFDSVWAVFKSHEEACAALSLSGSVMSVATALESELEPFHKLRRFVLKSPAPVEPTYVQPSPPASLAPPRPHMLHVSSSYSDLRPRSVLDDRDSMVKNNYTISSNPPNPRTSFRLGDWICNSPNCAAHNFGRNLACIGCGCPRSTNGQGTTTQHYQTSNTTARALPSPRFASFPSYPTSFSPVPTSLPPHSYSRTSQQSTYSPSPAPPAAHPPKSAHPLLTPSGRAFAVGGKVQNISSDPLSPCIMYWPDNEPFPEQGQIRPSGLVGVPPPILNTGNRGPISHQPGDWICLKCNYLNWRRRKVCQTCLPYAEGNGDSISAAVQAERVALLTSVLAQTHLSPSNGPETSSPAPQAMRSHSMTPPQARRSFVDISPPQSRGSVHRSQSHFELSAQYASSHPIYQTSGRRLPSPLYSTGPDPKMPVHAPAPLLPSFLQDMVQLPALSPTSTSSADLSFEEYEDSPPPSSAMSTFPTRSTRNSLSNSPPGNIWRLDGEESKSLSAFPLPNHHELLGGNRKHTQEKLRVQVVTS